MKRVWVLGGTTEGRRLLSTGLPILYTVATEYGAQLAGNRPNVEIRTGRLDQIAMERLLAQEKIACVLDATHPYAVEASRNAKTAAQKAGVPYIRVLRQASDIKGAVQVTGCDEAAAYLATREGKALITTGSKELAAFTVVPQYQERLFVRVLPTKDVLSFCETLGFSAVNIIAMQGPFSREMNVALLRQIGARFLVTKDGGAVGGFTEKLEAAREVDATVVLIARPAEKGSSIEEAIAFAWQQLGRGDVPRFPLWLDLSGRPALVVGGGRVAVRRAKTLLKCGAQIKLISPTLAEPLPVEHVAREYRAGDVQGMGLCVAATDDRKVNRLVGEEARAWGIPVSVADAPCESTFYFPALVVQGRAVVSVCTGGRSPALCHALAGRLRQTWPGWVQEEERR